MAEVILHLVRHPPVVVAPGVCYGQLDIPATGVDAAAERLRALLPPGLPVWTSPLRRCRELAACLHPQPVADTRLMEMHFGAWEGKAWDEIGRAALDAWAADLMGYAPPGGESAADLASRALEFIAALPAGEAVVVTHGGVIRVLLSHWQCLDSADLPNLAVDFGSLTTVEICIKGAILRRMNG